MKLILLRGIGGSGKSHLVRRVLTAAGHEILTTPNGMTLGHWMPSLKWAVVGPYFVSAIDGGDLLTGDQTLNAVHAYFRHNQIGPKNQKLEGLIVDRASFSFSRAACRKLLYKNGMLDERFEEVTIVKLTTDPKTAAARKDLRRSYSGRPPTGRSIDSAEIDVIRARIMDQVLAKWGFHISGHDPDQAYEVVSRLIGYTGPLLPADQVPVASKDNHVKHRVKNAKLKMTNAETAP